MNPESDLPNENISYLHAREPSLLAWGPSCNVPINLEHQLNDRTERSSELESQTSKEAGTLQVYLRIKKMQNFERLYEILDNHTLLCKIPEGAQCIRNRDNGLNRRAFKFSRIFGPQANQKDIFDSIIKEKILNFINGFNYSLLTYGASGSGKTFTIVGTESMPGIIPRALEYLFRTLPPLPENPLIKPKPEGGIIRLTELEKRTVRNMRQNLLSHYCSSAEHAMHTQMYRAMQQRLSQEPVAVISPEIDDISLSVWVSFAEIYNEHVYDLLEPNPPRGHQRPKLRLGACRGTAYIKGLTHVNVSSGLEAYHILQFGLAKLRYAATSVNDHSSRSHSIFTIKLAQSAATNNSAKEGISVSSFNFCDLAGSERMKKTQNAGERLKESNNINTSLLVLGRCVNLIREGQRCGNGSHNEPRLVPFRESKLTQLFQRALSGQEAISMIVNINPSRDMFDESQHVLNFSAIAKEVVLQEQREIARPVRERETRVVMNALPEESEAIQELQARIDELECEREQMVMDHEEDREHVIATYKNMMARNTAYWEERCRKAEAELLMYKRREVQAEINKERKISVINLDSSSDDSSADIETSRPKRKLSSSRSPLSSDIVRMQNENAELKLELQAREDDRRNNLVLKSETIKLQEQIEELNAYIEAVQRTRLANDTEDESKETVTESSVSVKDVLSFRKLSESKTDHTISRPSVLEEFDVEARENFIIPAESSAKKPRLDVFDGLNDEAKENGVCQ